MRRSAIVGIGIAILVVTAAFAADRVQEKESPQTVIAPLPDALDALYPPKAQGPLYLFKMLALGTSFPGIVADLLENDHENAMAGFETFKAQYIEVSKLVPEWGKECPMGPVEELGNALSTGEEGKVMAAYDKVGKLCHECHVKYMSRVQHKYHWGDFNAIMVEDPLTKEDVDFRRLKQYLMANFAGISVDVQQNQPENAQKQLQGFSARFQTLKSTCSNCHNTERKSYVDQSVQNLIDKLGQALSESVVDPGTVGALIQGIGMESCHNCHLVHSPAALVKSP